MKWNFKNFSWRHLLPILLSCSIGLGAGLSIYTFIYAKGYSYLSNNPEACANCHIMNDQYNGWIKSSHHTAATCNDCHTPHNPLGKYKTKAANGFWHSFYFTTGNFNEPIRIKAHNKEIAENNCRRCHQDIVIAMDGPHKKTDHLSCVQCHGSVGHP
ncbi:MAG: cytochrome c nitrite reductase small subunit [Elusimicrobia bacterium]|nr:cytochrome c nitrite reductase small subunit [Elusimicrobiota bacterium]